MQARSRKYAPDFEVRNVKEPAVLKKAPVSEEALDHFATDESGNRFAGRHIIMDIAQASPDALRDVDKIRAMLTAAAEEAGATLLGIDVHRFEGGGVTGIAVLAESHISIHTWPERSFAAVDVFMCGQAIPSKCVGVIRSFLSPKFVQVTEMKRGYFVDAPETA
jgi:S-adenosylmethionine decarboxylase